MSSVTALASAAAHVQKKAVTVQSRRAKREADRAEAGWSTYAKPKRLTYDEVAYASAACAALYRWATTAVDTALALQSLYPVKKEWDALKQQRAEALAQLAAAKTELTNLQAEEGVAQAEVERLTAELERLRRVLAQLDADAQATKAAADAAAAAANATAAEEAAAAEEARRKREAADLARTQRAESEADAHRQQQQDLQSMAERRQAAREEAVRRASDKIEVTHVDVVITQTLTFEKGQVVLQEMCIPALVAVAEVMKTKPTLKVNVRARGDDTDADNTDFQVRLRKDRGQAVCDWLVGQGGVSLSRLRTTEIGAGEGAAASHAESDEDGDWHGESSSPCPCVSCAYHCHN